MAGKQTKKLRQMYRRELRDELEHVKQVKREETEILLSHLNHVIARKPRLFPKFAWIFLVKKLLYR